MIAPAFPQRPLDDPALAAARAAVELVLDLGKREADPGRAAIDHAADRRAMAFAPCGDAEQMTECVVGHGLAP